MTRKRAMHFEDDVLSVLRPLVKDRKSIEGEKECFICVVNRPAKIMNCCGKDICNRCFSVCPVCPFCRSFKE